MPYDTIKDAQAAGFPAKIDGVELRINQINALSVIYDALKGNKDLDNPMAVAIAQFKTNHKIDGGQWVKVERQQEFEEISGIEFREVSIKSLNTRAKALSYNNRLHAMYVDNRQTGKAFSKAWVEQKHRELVEWMAENGWAHPTKNGALDKTLGKEKREGFDDSALKEGKPVLVLRLGSEYEGITNKKRVTVTKEMAEKMISNFNAGIRPGIEYGMPMDFESAPNDLDHGLANMGKGEPIKKPTDADRIAGYARKLFLSTKGIMAVPMWTKYAIDTIKRVGQIGISSFFGTDYFHKRTGKHVGPTFFNFTLTPRPQQTDLAVTAQALTDQGNDKNDIYITHVNFNEEEDTMSEDENKVEFSEKVTEFLGENPDEKVDEVVALTEAKENLEKEKVALEEKVTELEKRPALTEHEQVVERLSEVETTLNDQETAERRRIALAEEVATPAMLKTKSWARDCDPAQTDRETFDELIKNSPKIGDDIKGKDVNEDTETFADASAELAAKVDKAMKEKDVDRDKAEAMVFAENPGLMDRYVKESAAPKK